MKTTMKCQGVTLIELLMVILIAAVLLGLAVPSFTELRRENSAIACANQVVSAVGFARSTALNRGRRSGVIPIGNDWNQGWQVLSDSSGDNALNEGTDESVLRVQCTNIVVDQAPAAGIEFDRNGRPLAANVADLDIELQPVGCDDKPQRRRVTIGRLGHTTVESEDCPAI